MAKPVFTVDIANGAAACLEAVLPLSLLTGEGCFHIEQNRRLPLGIYNVSVARVSGKLFRLCQRLEAYFNASSSIEALRKQDESMQELLDYLELSLYAAAEHIDDITAIATGFFKTQMQRDKNPAYRAFQKEIKRCKRLVSSVANEIKHEQSRVRLFSIEFFHVGHRGCLHGYFMEGVDAGVVGPNRKFHSSQQVFSLTTLVWEILIFMLECSRALANFISTMADRFAGPIASSSELFTKVVIAAARLPLYSFGEEHPFSRVTLSIFASDEKTGSLDSGIYGSIHGGWDMSNTPSFGQTISWFSGDGTTKSFRFVVPKTISFHHWS